MTNMLNTIFGSNRKSVKFFFEENSGLLYKVIELLISQKVDKVFLSFFNHFTNFVKKEIFIIISKNENEEILLDENSESKNNTSSLTELYEDL